MQDLRELLRLAVGHMAPPSASILDSYTLPSTPKSGARAGYDGAKRRKGTKIHMVVDTLGHLLALHVTPADEQDQAQAAELAARIQEVTDRSVALAYVDQGDTGESAQTQGIHLKAVKRPTAKKALCCCRAAGCATEIVPSSLNARSGVASQPL